MTNIHRIKVYFGDTDAAGIVFYPNYYRWMDQAAGELFGKLIAPISKMQKEDKIFLPLLETHCIFRTALFVEDVVEIHSKVTEINNKTLRVDHHFIRGDETVAQGYEIRVWATKTDGKLSAEPVPHDVRMRLGIH
mgnify:CR=1 FL=1